MVGFWCDDAKSFLRVCAQRATVTSEGRCTARVTRSGAACVVRRWRGGDVTDAELGTTPSQTAGVRENNRMRRNKHLMPLNFMNLKHFLILSISINVHGSVTITDIFK